MCDHDPAQFVVAVEGTSYCPACEAEAHEWSQMDDEDRQRRLHEALDKLLDVRDGEVLAGWVVVYETATLDSKSRPPCVGVAVGPAGMTPWRTLGLLNWAGVQVLDGDDEGEDE